MGHKVGPIWNSLAYHGLPESRMKAAELDPKCYPLKYLAWRCEGARRIGESRAIADDERDRKAARRKPIVINLERVKVTPRDQQVLNLLVQGCSNKEIAGQLNISPRTVKQHLRTLFLRAGIREGRKRVKLAIAMFTREEAQS